MAKAARERNERRRRARVGNLRALLRNRSGPTLPDDDAGREYLEELLVAPSTAAHEPRKKMLNAVEVFAAWLGQAEAEELIDEISRRPIGQRMIKAAVLGERLRVTNAEREILRLWTIHPVDMTAEDMAEQRRAKARAREAARRRRRGSKARAGSLSGIKPWTALGIGRATYYRRRETNSCEVLNGHETGTCQVLNGRETNSCEVRILITSHETVSPEQASPPKGRQDVSPAHKPSKTAKAEGVAGSVLARGSARTDLFQGEGEPADLSQADPFPDWPELPAFVSP